MRHLINGNFSSISDAELITKISNNSTGMINTTPEEISNETEKPSRDKQENSSLS